MEDIKKFEPVVYWQDGIAERGRVLDITLSEEGAKFYIENLRTHEMITLGALMVFKESNCK